MVGQSTAKIRRLACCTVKRLDTVPEVSPRSIRVDLVVNAVRLIWNEPTLAPQFDLFGNLDGEQTSISRSKAVASPKGAASYKRCRGEIRCYGGFLGRTRVPRRLRLRVTLRLTSTE